MTTTITIEIDDTAAQLGDSPNVVAGTAEQAMVLEFFRRHIISASRGARLLDITLETFLKLAGSRRIPVFDITPDELREELRRAAS